MADIFLAVLDGPDGFSKTCVVKRILPEYANLDVFSRMFVGEARVAALLSHPNIVQVFDFGKIDGQYYLAMEWIQGASLDRVMRRAAKESFALGPRVAVDVGIAVAEALAYAHAKTLPDGTPLKLVHRDISPGNVLVSRDGLVKLADFGVVKSAVNMDRTVAGVVKGKYAYMSPEQLANREVDGRSDLFSLGIVLYEAATGRRLFKRETMEASVLAVSKAEVPRPSEMVPGFPPALERILLKLLAAQPEARYQSARELHADLERFRASENWTSGARELASMIAKLFPPDTTGAPPTAIPAPGAGTGSEAGTGRTPSGMRVSEPEEDSRAPTLDDLPVAVSIAGPAPVIPGAEGFPWWIAAAVGVAVVGTALFWFAVG